MVVGFTLFGFSMYLVPMASGPLVIAALFLMGNQLGDGFMTMYLINQICLRQAITSRTALGRVNAIVRSAEMMGLLIGAMAGGALAESIGMRPTLFAGATIGLFGVAFLVFSPILRMRALPSSDKPGEHDVLSP